MDNGNHESDGCFIRNFKWLVATAVAVAIPVITYLLPILFPLPPPPQCIIVSFQITPATGASFTTRSLITATPDARLLIEANIDGCDYAPIWHTMMGIFTPTSSGGIVYAVPDSGTDEITIILPDNPGEEQATLTVRIND